MLARALCQEPDLLILDEHLELEKIIIGGRIWQ